MNRRECNRMMMMMAALAGQSLTKSNTVFGAEPVRHLDRFGGWKGKRFEATGFFRVEKDERWWLVTPEGNAFLSFGINHLYPDLWKQDYNREAWQKRLNLDDLNDFRRFAPALRT